MSVKLSHDILGTGEPLLILHGLFGSKRNWLSIAKPLSEFCRVIAVDLRNHGDSPHAPTMSYLEMAEDVLQLADDLGLGQFNLAGHSMGGKVAMIAALQYSARIQRMIVLDIAPVPYRPGFARYLDAMQSLPLDRINSRKDAERHLASVVENDLVRQFLLQNLRREGDGFRWRINLPVIRDGLAEIGGFPAMGSGLQYAGPSLFVAGAKADYLRPEHEPAIRRLFPSAQFNYIENAGHWLHAEQPEAVIASFRQYLAR